MNQIIRSLVVCVAILLLASCNQDKRQKVLIETDYGDMVLVLYDSTPLHKENFIKLVNENFYDDLLFHRIIPGFMIQGGDPDSKNAPADKMLGMGGPGYQIPAEMGEHHFRGALAAARNGNPEKKSSGSQFYIVHGKPVNATMLENMGQHKGIAYDQASIDKYLEFGGTPQLDGEYTVFGMLIEGFDTLDKIALSKGGQHNRPREDIKMKITLL